MAAFWQDLSYASRTLRGSRGYTTVAILLLALGIGANTAVFSIVYAVLIRPLPYPAPAQLVQLVRGDSPQVSVPEYEFVRDHASNFSSAAAYRQANPRLLSLKGSYQTADAMFATANFLRTLGVTPAFGREFAPDETRPNGPKSTILSDALARRVFLNPETAVGRSILLDDVNYIVVGVLPPGFWFHLPADLLLPFPFTGSATDTGANSNLIARMRPGTNLEQAAAQLRTFTTAIRQTNSSGLSDRYVGLTPVLYQDQISGDTLRTNLLLLLGAVAIILLIACSNLASLALAKFSTRRKEVAVRLALGSGTWRLFQQFLLENLLLGLAGAAAGLLVGTWLLQALLAIVPFALPSSAPIELNIAALAITFVAAVTANAAASCLPLWASTRMNVGAALKAGSRSIQGEARQRFRSALVIAQVAASVTLLVSATLLIQSMYNLRKESLGFNPEGLTTFTTPVSVAHQGKPAEIRQFNIALLEKLRTLPGVQNVAAINVLPLTGPNNFPTQRDGHPEQSIGGMEIRQVSPGYFATMRIPIVRGRTFDDRDTAAGPPVILISEGVARAWWDTASPLGDRVAVGRFKGRVLGEDKSREVVGVIADTKSRTLLEPSRPTVYIPMQQWETGNMSWVVRGEISADQLRQTVAQIDPAQRIDRVRTMEDIVATHTVDSRFDAWLFGGIAALALLLTTVGVYGLLVYSVSRRTHEIGTRMALGATQIDVLTLILRQGGTLLLAGLALGLIATRTLSELLQGLLFGAQATNWSSYAAASLPLLLTGLLACYLPARRAANVDPLEALRRE